MNQLSINIKNCVVKMVAVSSIAMLLTISMLIIVFISTLWGLVLIIPIIFLLWLLNSIENDLNDCLNSIKE